MNHESVAALKRSDHAQTWGALILVQIMFGTFPLTGQWALVGLTPLALMSLRIGIAAILFTIYAGPKAMLSVDKSDILKLGACSLIGVFFNQWLFLEGLSRTSAINAAILCTAIPVWTLILAVLFRHEKASTTKFLGVLFAVGGALYLIRIDRLDFSDRYVIGNALIVTNCLFYATYLVFMRGILRRVRTRVAIAWVFAWASVGTLSIGSGELLSAFGNASASSWFWAGYVVAIPTIGAYFVTTWVQGRVAASVVGVFATLQPIIAASLDWAVYGKLPNERAALSGACILVGVWLTARK